MRRRLLGNRRRKELITEPNLIIGGMGGVITTKELLAGKLIPLTAESFDYFEIIGNDVHAIINQYYVTSSNAFTNSGITSFIETGGFLTGFSSTCFRDANQMHTLISTGVTVAGSQAFRRLPLTTLDVPLLQNIPSYTAFTNPSLVNINLPEVVTLDLRAFYDIISGMVPRNVYAPKCTTLEGDQSDTFRGLVSGSTVTLNIALQGSTHPSIINAESRGITFYYV